MSTCGQALTTLLLRRPATRATFNNVLAKPPASRAACVGGGGGVAESCGQRTGVNDSRSSQADAPTHPALHQCGTNAGAES